MTPAWVVAGGVSRSNKRYFYRNEVSGETQWNYPEQDIIGGQEAMDICTTPPPDNPPELEVPVKEPEPPPPPVICTRSPSPPPPPVITDESMTFSFHCNLVT